MARLLYLYIRNFDTNHFVPAHSHHCWELVYYRNAQGINHYQIGTQTTKEEIDFVQTLTNKKNVLKFSDGTFIVYPPNVIHDELTESNANTVSVGFDPEDDLEKAISALIYSVQSDHDYSVFKYIHRLEREYGEKQQGYQAMLDCIVREMLIHISRRSIDKTSEIDMDYVIRYLDEYFMTDINIDRLARMCASSPSHFRILFKAATNVSPKQYILEKRFAYIKNDLANSNKPLEQIARDSGFADYYQFSAFFKKKAGISPKQYRNDNHNPQL